MDFLNAIILLLNYIFVPALAYGSQLALGAIFVTLIYGILRFANFATGDMMAFGTMITILFTWYFFRCSANSINSNTFCNNF
jgi:branched-chain amino acid transport system permease protein